MFLRRFGALFLVLLLAACSIGTPRPPVPPPPPPPSPTPTATPLPTSTPARLVARLTAPVTPATPAASAPCTRELAEWTIGSFVAAFNRGDRDRLIAHLAQPTQHGYDPFRWFRIAEGGNAGTVLTTRDDATDYLLARQAKGERLGLLSVALYPNDSASIGGVDVLLQSQHPTIGERPFRAKAQINCGLGQILAWTMTDLPAPSGVQVTGNDDPLPPGCWSAEEVAGLFARFLDAFNRGDQQVLAGFFPDVASGQNGIDPEPFQWATISANRQNPNPFVARDRETLLRYFVDRRARGERLSLTTVNIATFAATAVTASATLTRTADDLDGHTATGIANINCQRGTIFIWRLFGE